MRERVLRDVGRKVSVRRGVKMREWERARLEKSRELSPPPLWA